MPDKMIDRLGKVYLDMRKESDKRADEWAELMRASLPAAEWARLVESVKEQARGK